MSCLSLGVCSKTFSSTIFNFYQQILLRLNNFTFPNHPLPSSVGASNWRFCRSCSSAPPTAGPGVNDPTVVAIFPSGSTGSDGAIMTVLPGVLTLSQVKVCEFTRRKNAKKRKTWGDFGGDVFVVACLSCFLFLKINDPCSFFWSLKLLNCSRRWRFARCRGKLVTCMIRYWSGRQANKRGWYIGVGHRRLDVGWSRVISAGNLFEIRWLLLARCESLCPWCESF